jgi:hypothetical protein
MSTFLIILLFYLALLKFSKDCFTTFTEKINSVYKYQRTNRLREYVSNKIDLKIFYPLFIIFSNILNGISLVFLNNYFEWHVIPIFTSLIGFSLVFALKFYNHSNMYRVAWNYFVSTNIQSFLLLKHYNYSLTSSKMGALELNSSLYLPLTIFILLLVSVILSLTFYFYSIKKLRCCNL